MQALRPRFDYEEHRSAISNLRSYGPRHMCSSSRPETYEDHRDYEFCAIGKSPAAEDDSTKVPLPSSIEEFENPPQTLIKSIHGFVADLWNIKQGDYIFFYVTTHGFKGVYRAVSEPFFDPSRVGAVGPERPFRILIEPVQRYDVPVPEEVVFKSSEYQRIFWVWYFAKMRGRGRGCHAIDPDARNKLIELLMKRNFGRKPAFSKKTYPTSLKHYIQRINLQHKDGRSIATENSLRAAILKSIRDQDSHVSPVVGPFNCIEWYGNNVPYHVSGQNIDLLMYHRPEPFSSQLKLAPRVQYSVIELKKDSAGLAELNQLLHYCEWAGSQLAEGELYTVQPILLARSFKTEVLEFLTHLRVGYRPIALKTYSLKNGQLTFADAQATTVQEVAVTRESNTKKPGARPTRRRGSGVSI